MKNNIVLCGFMGCGKSTIARSLAKMTGFKAVDTDSLIEEKEKMPIKEIFSTFGEEYFRRSETDTVKELAGSKNLVIATGGGAVLRKENADALKQSGFVVFLDIGKEEVLRRLSGDTSRPLLNRPDKETAVENLLRERRPLYSAVADCTISAEESPNEIAKKILALYRNRAEKS